MSSSSRITFNRPTLVGRELEYIRETIEQMHTAACGDFSRRCENFLRERLGAESLLLTTSCTDALEMAALLLDLQAGDEIIFPSFAFVSTVNPFVLRGVRPVFCDVRADTLNLDESRIEAAITPRTRAIVPLHYAGVACEMDAINELAERHGLSVIEDNAHGLFGKYRRRPLGALAPLAAHSFHETKNVICGEGGALAIHDARHVDRAEVLRDKGTDRQRMDRGEVDKYTWVDIGSSFGLSDILAAFLMAQFEQVDTIQARREEVWNAYDERLRPWAGDVGLKLPTVPGHCEQSFHMYYMLVPQVELRDPLIAHLASQEIAAVFHYQALHRSEMARRLGVADSVCPVSETVSDSLLRLPFHRDLTEGEIDRVVAGVRDYFEDSSRRR
ncbi:MAG: dTDP-4-amino-4,6-dideoxygalactose transaminase [Acidobacteriota bacterium]|nr:dTDP-4-amino-4,6-dideoxygalactose transaminase [Acidobacteriota bacterium]